MAQQEVPGQRLAKILRQLGDGPIDEGADIVPRWFRCASLTGRIALLPRPPPSFPPQSI